MTPAFVLAHTIPAAMGLLPAKMDTPAARAMLLVIGLQESKFQHRLQINGPARGFWQFEKDGGVRGVFVLPESNAVCAALNYPPHVPTVYDAVADNDVLACAFARLLIWTLSAALPGRGYPEMGWNQYVAAWRPGKPHPETWLTCWARAWETVEPTEAP